MSSSDENIIDYPSDSESDFGVKKLKRLKKSLKRQKVQKKNILKNSFILVFVFLINCTSKENHANRNHNKCNNVRNI